MLSAIGSVIRFYSVDNLVYIQLINVQLYTIIIFWLQVLPTNTIYKIKKSVPTDGPEVSTRWTPVGNTAIGSVNLQLPIFLNMYPEIHTLNQWLYVGLCLKPVMKYE